MGKSTSEIINDLLNEMYERLQYLNTLDKTSENVGRIREITNCIIKVQQIGLDNL